MRDRTFMNLDRLLKSWREDPSVGDNISAWETVPARQATWAPFPQDLHENIQDSLNARNIEKLFSHQAHTWDALKKGKHVVLVTGTASGKTLAYNLPVLDHLMRNPLSRALYIFPTKALAQDQKEDLLRWSDSLIDTKAEISPATYDGDTPNHVRSQIRTRSRIIITNPDMLHMGILPHHTNWAVFFQNLSFIVMDEIHSYRGVFGSHVANVMRRLRRVVRFYDANPQFVFTSATIANPRELAERLIEESVVLIDEDGSALGDKHFLIYNPPVTDPKLGIRRNVLQESARLADDLLVFDAQTILFGRARRSIEIMLTYLRESSRLKPEAIRGYRGGYLPRQRRSIESGLRSGSVRCVVATNALELGIDIGGMQAAVLAGYPGTIAGTWQQAGRAGRSESTSLAILVASSNPLDQFLAHNPAYFFSRGVERALINPDNLLILLGHIRCAAFELPFNKGERFGNVQTDKIEEILKFLTESGEIHESKDKYFWIASNYPTEGISLRNASPERVTLQAQFEDGPTTIGEVDLGSAYWMVHPQAIYIHEGQSFLVEDLDLIQNVARLLPAAVDYYTQSRSETTVQLITQADESDVPGGTKAHGDIQVTRQVIGFHKIRWFTHERVGSGEVDLPPSDLITQAYWLALAESTIDTLRAEGKWNADPNQYGPAWNKLRAQVRARDEYRCQVCGKVEGDRTHDVHHITPLRAFISISDANRLDNLITLCQSCHRKAETVVRIRSGLSGLAFILGNLAPLYLMCDRGDLSYHVDPQSPLTDGKPTIVIYDIVPAGLGFSERLYEVHDDLIAQAYRRVETCECAHGCPSCTGPGGEGGYGGKNETTALLERLIRK